ncbi:SANT/Myb domain [Dillenia turbinata]|uniref:SANT/Myb domain n=1 Tax=Dillenia turbinata TaxID=194707 RepID=A0AAN8ZJP5_9MAGN
MDEDICCWILEYLLLQHHLEDSILNRLLTIFPVSDNDVRSKRMILLRGIQSELGKGRVSEKVLELLEFVEELDHREGIPTSEKMRGAYCAAVVDCTMKSVIGSADVELQLFNAVKRIWKGRVLEMEKLGSVGLISDEIRKWRDEFEKGLWNEVERGEVLRKGTEVDAARLVREYVEEAWESLGPSFLELAAETFIKKKKESDVGANVCQNLDNVEDGAVCNDEEMNLPPRNDGNAAVPCDDATTLRTIYYDDAAVMDEEGHDLGGNDNNRVANSADVQLAEAVQSQETQKGNRMKRKHVAGHARRRCTRRVEICGSENLDSEEETNQFDTLTTPVVNKAQEALKTSSMELQAAVKDPLPDALRMAERLASEKSAGNISYGPSVENPNRGYESTGDTSAEKSLDGNSANEGNLENQESRHQSYVRKCNLMERNSTAHTVEWDDSEGGASEGLPDQAPRPHLCSPNTGFISPLRKSDAAPFGRRRRKKKWSVEEEDKLIQGVKKFGEGNWKLILDCYREVFQERTSTDLKDKWRNLMRYPKTY